MIRTSCWINNSCKLRILVSLIKKKYNRKIQNLNGLRILKLTLYNFFNCAL